MSATPLNLALDQALPQLAARRDLIRDALVGLDRDGLWWLSGYAAGLAAARECAAPVAVGANAAAPAPTLTIVHGSQTGNARRAAEALRDRAQAEGVGVRLLRAADYALKDLAAEHWLVVAISTHGDGDPPDTARAFVEALLSRRAPRLEQLQYAVLGLGDSSYPKFCHVARLFDERLAELGARRLHARGECDVDVDSVAAPWRDTFLGALRPLLADAAPRATVTPIRPLPQVPSRDRPFAARVLANERLTAPSSHKDVRHLELDLSGSGLSYLPGDSLGVWPRNPPALVEQVLAAASLDGAQTVEHGGRTLELGFYPISTDG
jgi:sulfite reductase (NADPH) flavoprotein alpha-component